MKEMWAILKTKLGSLHGYRAQKTQQLISLSQMYQMYKHNEEEETSCGNTFICLDPLVAFITQKKTVKEAKNKTGSQE